MSLSSPTITAQKSVKVKFTMAKAATVQLQMKRMVRGKAKLVGTVTLKNRKAGKHTYTLTLRFAGRKLDKGNYRLTVRTTRGKRHSNPVTKKISVR